MTKDIDTTGAFGTSANCLPATSFSLGVQSVGLGSVSVRLDLDLSPELDLDLSEGPGYVDSAIKHASTETFNPTTDRVVFQAAKGLDLIL